LLSLFQNRFMSVAEAMGVALQKTSVSTNIKERLDFSCALFSPSGDLIANAPHLPVHLGEHVLIYTESHCRADHSRCFSCSGSMSFAVKFQINLLGIGADAPSGNGIEEGDVILTNAPKAGGSHLPDITVITPVFDEKTKEIIFFTASRGHHADVGGILPGSMPPTSTTIFQEGAQVTSFKIVKKGKFDQEGMVKHLVTIPASYEGSSGTRCLRDVQSDLQAQIAANNKGTQLIYSSEWQFSTRSPVTDVDESIFTANSDRGVHFGDDPRLHEPHPGQRRAQCSQPSANRGGPPENQPSRSPPYRLHGRWLTYRTHSLD
jgi:5-oxoprolinase (ATP-hydrolysing)